MSCDGDDGIFDLHPEPLERGFSAPGTPLGPAGEEVARALTTFDGYPTLHGTLRMHDAFGDDHLFELWIEEPRIRIDAVIPGASFPWVGETGEPAEDPWWDVNEIDPLDVLSYCEEPELVGHESVLSRATSVVVCHSGLSAGRTVWIDDATGLLLRSVWKSNGESAWFEFAELEIDGEIPPEVFEVDALLGI